MTIVDTQAVLWLTQDQGRLTPAAQEALAEAGSRGELAIAGITLSELAMVILRGRVKIDRPVEGYLRFIESTLRVLPITPEIAIQAHRFSAVYPRDPADRIVGATAVVHGGRLVTSDQAIRLSGEVPCVW